ncbi:TolC family protein [Sulfurovum sp.]|uniref:TolC family protein n=1 Tax=Sulfurovum sp. TaxID=1969726 RepID=UPI002868215C|nr:TolC family protein [Sulfurovum sp.]
MKKYLIFLLSWPLFAGLNNLDIKQAVSMLENNNLELKISHFTEQMKAYEAVAAKGNHYGKLDVSLAGMRSNDAGSVFGFKLQSREATFGDFGFSAFDPTNPALLTVQPNDLNYPETRNHYVSKVSYTLPLYTGGKLSEYGRITDALHRMSQWDTQKLMNEKIFQTKKAFYDISLVENYISNLSKIINNIQRLETIVKNMAIEGYAQEIDLLEVQARGAEAESMYNQAKLNKNLAYQFLSFLLNEEVSSIKRVNDMAPMPSIITEEIESNNIDIQKSLLGLQISEMAMNVEKANYLPTVGAFGEYGSADNELWNDFSQKDFYTVGLQLKWNIFNGGTDAANLEKAKVNHLKTQDQVSLAKSGVALQVKKLETEILSKNADVKNFDKQLNFAKKVYENYQSRYREGIASISDVLMKQSKELEVLLKLLTIKNERNTKIFELNSILNTKGNRYE